MKNQTSCISILFLVLAASAMLGFATPGLAAYSLVWSDDFDGDTLDSTKWGIDIGNGCPDLCGWGNNELQYYRSENVSVSGGNLILTSLNQYYAGSSFTSGKVTTHGKHSFLYGRIEMRAKIPTGGGMWPAFWMMPEDDVYGGWASSGEIDIMESANNTTSVGGTLHFGGSWPDNASTGASYSLGGANFADEFHTYAVEWEPDVIRWYVDGTLYSTKTSSQWYSNGAPGNPLAPFDQEFYIILNSAVGGNYTGCLSQSCITADLPQQFLIDYVRVYQESPNNAPTVTITAPVEGETIPSGTITIDATASDVDGPLATVEFYNGTTYLGEDTDAPYSFSWYWVPDGCYDIIAKAIDEDGAIGTDSISITVGAGCGQEPFLGVPFVLPTKIETEDFDAGGNGIAYYDQYGGNQGSQYRTTEDVDIEICADAGGGYDIGWILPGEWLEYTVFVPAAGEYTIETRVASLSSGGAFHLNFNGVNKTGEVTVPVTTGWQTWETVSATATLSPGLQTMRFVSTTEGFNVNYFEFFSPATAALPDLQQAGYALNPCYPNPFNPMTTISYDVPVSATVNLTIFDVAGKLVKTLVAAESVAAGRHEAIWNGRNTAGEVVAAGVYFYHMDADGYKETRRMALVK